MARIATTITTTGPFFTRDPAKTFRANARTMMEALAKEGEADVRAQMAQGQGARAPISLLGDRVSEHVHGRAEALNGKRWTLHAVVSVNNSGFSKAEGTSLMAAAASVEGRVHAFRRTKTRLSRARAVNAAELMKGLT